MFVTKKKFNELIKAIKSELSKATEWIEVFARDIQELALRANNVELNVDELMELRDLRNEAHRAINGKIVAASIAQEHIDVALNERLREAETRIDNLIEANNDAAQRHNHNIYTSNEAIDKCNARFAKYEALIENLQSQIQTQSVINKHAIQPITDLSAVYFHYAEDLEIGLTYWLKVCSYFEGRATLQYDRYLTLAEIQKNSDVGCKPSHIMVMGRWDGMKFTLPDGEELSHKSVVEVGDIIETPIIED